MSGFPVKVNETTRKLNPGIFEPTPVQQSPFERYAQPTKGDLKEEKEFQKLCEQELTRRGFVRLSAPAVESALKPEGEGFPGWFGHWPRAERNPLMPDLFIVDAPMRNCLMVELKTHNKYQPGQKELIFKGCWYEVRTFPQFRQLLDWWGNKPRRIE